jgi:hypothetical protein
LLDTLEQTDTVVYGGDIYIEYTNYVFGSSVLSNPNNTNLVGLFRRSNQINIKEIDDFTFSCWFRPTTLPSTTSTNHIVFSLNSDTVVCQRSTSTGVKFVLGQYNSTGTFTELIVHDLTIAVDTYYHLAIECHQQNIRLYVNGVQADTLSTNPDVKFNTINGFCLFGVGAYSSTGTFSPVSNRGVSSLGYMDEIVVDNFGRYKGIDFVLPTSSATVIGSANLGRLASINAAANFYTVGGQSASLAKLQRVLSLQSGAIIFTGQDINIKRPSQKFKADVGTLNILGKDVNEGPYYVENSVVKGNWSGSSPYTVRTFSPPTNYQLNDIIIFVAETTGEATTYPSLTGWNLLAGCPIVDVASSTGSKLYVWWRRVQSTLEPSWALPVFDHVVYASFLIRNAVSTGDPISVSTTNSSASNTTTVTIPSVTIPQRLNKVFICAADPVDSSSLTRYSNITNSGLLNITEHFESGGALGNGGGFVVGSGSRLQSGTIASTTITKATSSTFTAIVFAVKTKVTPNLPIIMVGASASISVNGQNAGLFNVTLLAAGQGTYSLTGHNATVYYSRSIKAESRALSATGHSSLLIINRKLGANSTSSTLTGQNAILIKYIAMSAASGVITHTGKDANFTLIRGVNALKGTFSALGQQATLTGPAEQEAFGLGTLLEDDLLSLDF